MKQLRWIAVLAAAAILLGVIFIIVDQNTKKKEEQKKLGEAKTLFSFEGSNTRRIDLENEEGHFIFDWDNDELLWRNSTENDPFDPNPYTLNAIINYFSTLKSLRTIEFDCKNTSVYGFDHPITLKITTTENDNDHPYVLYVGDATPTYDAYYAMLDGSDDVYTIDYNSGTVFCSAKNMLKNRYVFFTTVSQVSYYKIEREGAVTMEMERDSDYLWTVRQPADFQPNEETLTDLLDSATRVQVTSFVEETSEGLDKYGLDHPHTKIWLRGVNREEKISTEVWFGDNMNETEMYAYLPDTKQVCTVALADVTFLNLTETDLLAPFCLHDIDFSGFRSIEADMGDVYDLHETLTFDSTEQTYRIGDTEINKAEREKVTAFTNFVRSLINLHYTDLALDEKPDPEAEPAMRITYSYADGRRVELTFIEKEKNLYYLMRDGKYAGVTVRLNEFSATGSVIESHAALKTAMQ